MRWRPSQTPAQPQPRPAGPSFTQPIRRDPSPATPPVPPAVENKPAPELDLAPPAPPLVPKEAASVAPAPAAEDLMVSLEEEMAKLLGRTPDKP
jgi:flagellar protein FliO/FliZ